MWNGGNWQIRALQLLLLHDGYRAMVVVGIIWPLLPCSFHPQDYMYSLGEESFLDGLSAGIVF